MSKVRITQIRSSIDYPAYQKQTLVALGIRKMHGSVEKEATPQIQGMISAVKHLVKVENI
jgi:large subunit ribosomal protein L30